MSITCGGHYDSGPNDAPDTEDEPYDRRTHGLKYATYANWVRRKFSSHVFDHEIGPLYKRDISVGTAAMLIKTKRLRKKREAQLPEPLEKECLGIIDALHPACWGNRS